MPRCGCASDQCACRIISGINTEVTGTGTAENPYRVDVPNLSTQTPPPSSGGGERFIGEVIMWSGINPPDSSWAWCDGSAISRSVYSVLYGIISTAYGAGNGSTTFNLPNFSERAPMGSSGGYPRGSTVGTDSKALTTANMPSHTHSMSHDHGNTGSAGAHTHDLDRSQGTGTAGNSIPRGDSTVVGTGDFPMHSNGSHTHNVPAHSGNTGSAGSGAAFDPRGPRLAIGFCIKII